MKHISLITLLLVACAGNSYKIHIGQSYFDSVHPGSIKEYSQIQSNEVNAEVTGIGVYSEHHPYLEKYPVLRTYHPKFGLTFIPISEKLNCNEGALVKITGRIKQDSIQYSYIKKMHHYNLLEPVSVNMLEDNTKTFNRVMLEYQKVREKIQWQIQLEDSKLNLSPKPAWIVWYDAAKKKYIFTSFQYDLMYAANIEFIVDSKSHQIKSVYAKQWFKGEL